MKTLGRYDGVLQMFVEEPREVDRARLGFLRWLGERGKLEHRLEGPSVGELCQVVRPEFAAELPLAS